MSAVLAKPGLSRWGKSPYETEAEIELERRLLSSEVELYENNHDAEIIVVHSKLQVNAEMLQKIPSAQLVITTTSGHEHMDVKLLQKNGIRAVRMPLVRRDAVVESALAMILDATRKHWYFRQEARLSFWARGELPNILPRSLGELTIGIVGCGVIGRKMIEVLQAMGAKLVACDPNGVPHGVEELSAMEMPVVCDVVSLHCDHNPSSHQLISQNWLSLVKAGLILINTARGKLIDLPYAIEALDDGLLGYLGVDVFPDEPYQNLNEVNGRANLCFTPHASGYHGELAKMIRQGLLEYIKAYRRGERLKFEL